MKMMMKPSSRNVLGEIEENLSDGDAQIGDNWGGYTHFPLHISLIRD
jgi:hypothetical protein